MRTTYLLISERFEKELADADLPDLGIFGVLVALSEAPEPSRPRDLLCKVNVTKSGLTRLVDRIEGTVETGPPGAFERPTGSIEGVRMEAWAFGPGPTTTARVLVDAGHVATARGAAPSATVVEERADGSAVLELEVRDVDPFRSFVLGFLEHAEVVDPPELRSAVVDWLHGIADRVPAG